MSQTPPFASTRLQFVIDQLGGRGDGQSATREGCK